MKRGRDKFVKYEWLINIIIILANLLPSKIREGLLVRFRFISGIKGLLLRYVLIKTLARSCGKNVTIHPGVYIFHPKNLSLGNNVSIHPMCYLECGTTLDSGIIIGNDVSIAHGVSFIATSHIYTDVNKPIKDQGVDEKKIIVKDDVWIGAKATILYGRIIESGSIVASNSVVTHNVIKNTIVGGIPGKLIKSRVRQEY
ncbi:acyltransferase [Salinicoccus roseus]|uniref:acyltransferase n=1 Tax=Salinicoccus roseus TaxID=45670 RepID=UPI00230070B3|nr:acyltransferase [Salinicoccus roseus]